MVDSFSKSDQDKITSIKKLLPTEHKNNKILTDFFIYRFLVAKKWDVHVTVNSIISTLIWREKIGADKILINKPNKIEEYLKCWNGIYHKFDREGRPLTYTNAGFYFSSKIIDKFSFEEFEKCLCYMIEHEIKRMEIQTKKLGRRVSTTTSILDLKDLDLSCRHFLPYIKFGTSINETHYPETLGKILVINAPMFFPTLFNIVKKFLDPNIKEKIYVINDNYQEALLKIIDEKDIPLEYGGTCRCFEWGCMPERYIGEITNKYISKSVSAGYDFVKILKSEKNGGTFFWSFKTNRDINFSVKWESTDHESKAVEIQKLKRVEPNKLYDGIYTSDKEGQCIFVWCNKYSYIRSKNIEYCLEVENMTVKKGS